MKYYSTCNHLDDHGRQELETGGLHSKLKTNQLPKKQFYVIVI
jgi:hypothetical protein